MESVHLQLSEELLARIDAERGMVARNRWIRWAVEQALVGFGDAPRQRAHTKSEDDVAITPAPAEQPEQDEWLKGYQPGDAPLPRLRLRAPSSVQAKRDVRPVPKAKP